MRPLSCAEARQEAARRVFPQEELEAHVEATLTAHLAVCSECRLYADGVERAARLVARSVIRHDPPPTLEKRVVDAARTAPARGRRTVARAATMAAAIMLVATGIALLVPGTSGPARQTVLSPTDRFPRVTGSATLGDGRAHVVIDGLPSLAAGSAYAVWVGDGRGPWRRLGTFRSSDVDSFYDVPGAAPELVRVTIEPVDVPPEVPGVEVLTGRW